MIRAALATLIVVSSLGCSKLSDMFETADPGTTVDLEIDDWDAIKDALSKVKFNSTALSRQMMPFIEAIEQAELIEVPRQPVLAP